MKNMVYIQSGGPTSVINTSLYGAIKEAKRHPEEIGHIYGSQHGVEGLIFDDLIDLGLEDEEQIELLLQTPGSILGTTRRKLPNDIHDELYTKIIENLKKHNIGYVFVNGGNDSMDTCYKLSLLVKELGLDIVVVGVPKTIDNDLAGTDHSLGFPSAAKYIINTVESIVTDASCFMSGKVHVVEIMGRVAGWLSACPDLLPEGKRPDLFYFPESKFDLEDFLAKLKKIYDQKKCAIVCICEGLDFPRDTKYMTVDAFGHAALDGAGLDLCHIINDRLGLKTRSVELSLMQRACPENISLVDRNEAIHTGELAVQTALKGITGNMIVFKRVSNNPYQISYELEDLSKIANAVSTIPEHMICDDTKMAQSFRDYLLPLIQGEVNLKYENGIVKLATLKRIKVQ